MASLTSVELLTYAANSGVIEAQVALAVLHEHGVLVDQSYEKARHWYEESAQGGSAFSMNELALYLEKGKGGAASAPDAFQRANDAAKRKYIPAIFTLARYYEAGIGTAQDLGRASQLYEEAAEAGFAPAAGYLALVYEDGLWGKKDQAKALHFAALAATLGDSMSAHMIGQAFESGRGVPVDDATAVAWYERAAESGDPFASMKLAVAYSFGQLGLKPNKERADYYFKRTKEWKGP